MGVAEGDPASSDNHKTLNNTAATVAAFRTSGTSASFNADPQNSRVPDDAGTQSIAVSNLGTPSMNWTAAVTNDGSWLIITSGSSGTDDGTIETSFTANAGSIKRTGIIELTSVSAANSPYEITVTQSAAQTYASLPYTTGFESGSLDQYWQTNSTNSNGRLQVTTSSSPHSGSYHLTLDVISFGAYSRNEAMLHLALSSGQQAKLDFWWKEFGDESHVGDALWLSDDGGSNFTQVYAFSPALFQTVPGII